MHLAQSLYRRESPGDWLNWHRRRLELAIINLQKTRKPLGVQQCDVCIIGAGAVGCYLAARLGAAGLRVVVVEAGNRIGKDFSDIGFGTEFVDEQYGGAIAGRTFGLGGTTTRWGGVLIPHSCYDKRSRCDATDSKVDNSKTWEHVVAVVEQHQSKVLGRLGYKRNDGFSGFAQQELGDTFRLLAAQGIAVASSLFLPFRRKNLLFLLELALRSYQSLVVVTNAVAKKWQYVTKNGLLEIKSVDAVSADGHSVRVAAREFVIASGAIESARILLELKADSPPHSKMSAEIGYGLGDHLSVPIASVDMNVASDLIMKFGPRFVGSWMRSFRFLDASCEPNLPRYFAHFIFDNENAGFRLAKSVLTALQARRLPRIRLTDALRGISGVAALAWSRFAKSRLFIPQRTKVVLQLDVEQIRNDKNRVSLGDALDVYGRRAALINWRISDDDQLRMRDIAERFLRKWNQIGGTLPTLVPIQFDGSREKPHDAYHPVGMCRMGIDMDAVVDLKLRVNGLSNVSLASTAVFPTAGTANPTFTLLCLTEALGESLITSLAQNSNWNRRRELCPAQHNT